MKKITIGLICLCVLLSGCATKQKRVAKDYEALSNQAADFCFSKGALKTSNHCASYSGGICNTSNVYFECYRSVEESGGNIIYSGIRSK